MSNTIAVEIKMTRFHIKPSCYNHQIIVQGKGVKETNILVKSLPFGLIPFSKRNERTAQSST